MYLDLPWETVFNDDNFDKLMSKNDYFSLFLDWKERNFFSVWIAKRYEVEDQEPVFEPKKLDFYGAKHIDNPDMKIHPLLGWDASGCPSAGNGLWKDKMQLFLPDSIPSFNG